jgi:hypothetical protein
MSLRCSICGQTWDSLPQNAISISTPRGGSFRLYKIGREVHNLASVKAERKKAVTKPQEKI